MTVSSETNRNAYVATAGQTLFTYSFYILAKEHIAVYQNDTLLTLTTHYTVQNVGQDTGGTITLVTGATVNDSIVLLRSVPLTQDTDYVENDAFPAQTHEDGLDKLTMAVQELDEVRDRTIALAESSSLTNISLPDPGANLYIKWNAAGTALETSSSTNADAVLESEYVANSIRYKQNDGTTMANVVLAASEIPGRKSSGEITNMTGAEFMTETTALDEVIPLILALG